MYRDTSGCMGNHIGDADHQEVDDYPDDDHNDNNVHNDDDYDENCDHNDVQSVGQRQQRYDRLHGADAHH